MANSPSYIFGGDTGETPESIRKKRAVAEALFRNTLNDQPHDLGSGLNAIGKAIIARVAMGKADVAEKEGASRSQRIMGALMQGSAGMDFGPSALSYDPAGASAASSSSSGSAAKLKASAFDSDNGLPDYANAFLDTIAGPESGGAYNVAYGGGTFDDFADHPRRDMPITSGPNQGKTSSAAGRYQFLGSTWDGQKSKLGLSDFSPANQDIAAYALAADTYKAKTGRDLDAALQSGDPNAIAGVGKTLSGIWTSLPGGIEQGTNTPRFMSAYQSALKRTNSAVREIEAAAPVQTASADPDFMPDGPRPVRPDLPPEVAASLSRTPEQQQAGYNRAMTAAVNAPSSKDAAVIAALGPAPAPPEMSPKDRAVMGALTGQPIPAGLSPAVQAAAAADPNFDGFAQSSGPATGQPTAGVRLSDPNRLPPVPGGRNGPDPQLLMQVMTDPFSSEEARSVASSMLDRAFKRQDLAEQRAYEASDPDNVLKRQYMRAQIDAMGAKQPNTTNDIREYQFAQSQGFTGSFADYQQSMRKAGATTVSTGGENTSEFTKKSDEAAAKRLGDIVEAGNSAPEFMGSIQQLADLGKSIGTGRGAQVTAALGPYADMVGIKLDGLDEAQAFNSIVAKVAPNMRPAGAGATSDFDARQFLQSLPSLGNTPGGNEMIADTFRAVGENRMAAAEIAQRAQSGELKWQEAERQIRQLPNPYERFKSFRANPSPPPAGAGAAQAAPGAPQAPALPQQEQGAGMGGNWPQGGQLSRPRTDAEFNALPKGALYVDPDDGQTYRK